MSRRTQNWTIELRGYGGVVEIVLNDHKGRRASRVCTNGEQLRALLDGWEWHFGCEVNILFAAAWYRAPLEIMVVLDSWETGSDNKRGSRSRTLDPATFERTMKLAENPYRPKEIRDLKKKIENETRLADIFAKKTGMVNRDHVQQIVTMKMRLDNLYLDWTEGTIG